MQTSNLAADSLYGSHPIVLLNELHLFSVTQHSFILIAPYMYATRFGPFSGHHQACQYNNHLKELTTALHHNLLKSTGKSTYHQV